MRSSGADEEVDILVVAVDLGRMALAAAEGALPEAKLIEHICGDDPALLALPYLCFRERTRLSKRSPLLERGGE
jgi:hypothetical protein